MLSPTPANAFVGSLKAFAITAIYSVRGYGVRWVEMEVEGSGFDLMEALPQMS
jgi:hypothetical protein